MGIITDIFLPLALAFIMFALGLGLTGADFLRVLKQPKDFLNGAKFYHRIDVDPYWNSKMIKVMQIGDHIFWKDYVNE